MNPIDTIKGKIIKYDERRQVLIIEAPYDNIDRLMRRDYKDVEITLIDSRSKSIDQLKMCWSLIGAIAEWQGEHNKDYVKKQCLMAYCVQELQRDPHFAEHLSNMTMSEMWGFQNFLVEFIIGEGIPTNIPLKDYTSDTDRYVYMCLIHKKCAICGKPITMPHHLDRVGMGRDRQEIIHEGMEVFPACWGVNGCHNLAHIIGDKAFLERYHFDKGIILDKTLCKIYGLKTSKEKA